MRPEVDSWEVENMTDKQVHTRNSSSFHVEMCVDLLFPQIALYLGPALNAERLPLLLLGCCALFGGLLALLLPETLGIPLMVSLDELDGISARTKPFFAWWTRARLRESLERNAEIRDKKALGGQPTRPSQFAIK